MNEVTSPSPTENVEHVKLLKLFVRLYKWPIFRIAPDVRYAEHHSAVFASTRLEAIRKLARYESLVFLPYSISLSDALGFRRMTCRTQFITVG